MKRRILACLLAMLLCFGVPVNAVALDLTITQQGEVQRGQTLVYEVRMTDTVTANSGSILVEFDPEVLTYVNATWHITGTLMAIYDPATGVGVFACMSPISVGDLIFSIEFLVKDDAAYGDATVSFDTTFKNTTNSNDDVVVEDTPADTFVSCMDHQPGEAATCGTAQLCTVCQYVIAPATGHIYSQMDGDDTYHWASCVDCGLVDEASRVEHTSSGDNLATCVAAAVCDTCGRTYGQVNPENHTGNTTLNGALDATCDKAGYTGDTYCLDCNELLSTGTEIPATGDHKDADGKWEADSDAHFHTCACGYIFDTTAHSGGTATCSEKAKCQECGQEYGQLNSENHVGGTYVEGAKEATCYEQGYTGDTKCSDCHTVLTYGEAIPETEHDITDWQYDEQYHWKNCKEPNCTFFGFGMYAGEHSGGEATCSQKAVCEVCNAPYGSVDDEKHMNTELRGAKAATEDAEGYTGDTFCLDCQKVIEEGTVIAKLPHTHNMKAVAAKAATCTAVGNIAYWNCTKCGKYYTDNSGKNEITLADTVVAKLAHNYTVLKYNADSHWYQCAACSATNGQEQHKGGTATCLNKAVCTVCNQAYGALAAHNYGENADAKYLKTEADCVNKAVYYNSCTVCQVAGQETFVYGEVNSENHVGEISLVGAKEATCTEDGYTGDTVCQSCNAKLTEGEIIPKAHSLKEVAAVEATHESDGNIGYYHCQVCEKLFLDENAESEINLEDTVVAKGEHIYGEKYACDKQNHWKACECGHTTEKEAHSFGDWVVTKEAGKNQKGLKEKTCETCGYKITEEIPAVELDTPQTGDLSNVLLWMFVMVLSACALVFVTFFCKKRNQW